MAKWTASRNWSRGPVHNISSNGDTAIVHSGPWASAIQEATAYAFASENDLGDLDGYSSGYGHYSNDDTRDSNPKSDKKTKNKKKKKKTKNGPAPTPLDRVDCSMKYLETLRELLEQQENWEWVPYPCHPPSFHRIYNGDDGNPIVAVSNKENTKNFAGPYNGINDTRSKTKSSPKVTTTTTTTMTMTTTTATKRKMETKQTLASNGISQSTRRRNNWIDEENRYSSMASGVDSDSDEEEEEEEEEEEDDVAAEVKGGSKTSRNNPPILSAAAIPYDPSLYAPPDEDRQHQFETMDTVRLLIRLHASQSDLHAKKARLLATQRRWLPGAGALQSSIVALAQGLELADAAISKTLAAAAETPSVHLNHGSYTKTHHRLGKLERDAEITSVSSCYLVYEKDRYLKAAHKQATKLESILKPMWEQRDQARKRLGNHYWVHNPNSTGHYAKMRLQHERELRALEQALEQLEDSKTDASSLVDEAGRLREKLKDIKYSQNRYNGKRKSSLQDATEAAEHGLPVQYGWTFTGSLDAGGEDCVEFYERWVGVGSSAPSPLSQSDVDASVDVDRVGYSESGKESASTNAEAIGNINNGFTNDERGDQFVFVQLDVHYVTGAVRTVVHYPARYNSNDGSLLQPEWKLPNNFPGNVVDPGLYHCILADPLSVRGSTVIANGMNAEAG